MTYRLRKRGIACALASAGILAACSGDPDNPMSYEDASEEYAEDGVELGTIQAALSQYPKCQNIWSDPDRDGWGWEYNRSCIVEAYFPTCQTTTSDPDGDGWGWENSRNCKVRTTQRRNRRNRRNRPTQRVRPARTKRASTPRMAALAVSAAMEMKRWQPSKDFVIGGSATRKRSSSRSTGKARCSDGVCANTQGLLDFQKNEANGQVVFPGNVALNPGRCAAASWPSTGTR